jgi:glycosyltransferase involved in cell wall biosynthesis
VKLFLAGTSLHPAYGGPAYSVSRLAVALTDAGVQVGLWSPDQSAVTTPLLPIPSSVERLTGTEVQALDSFGAADVLHDNGIWWPHNHRLADLAAARRIPRVVSIRGMLEPWAMNHKRLKKRVAWWFYQRRDLRRATCHHTTAEAEASHVRHLALGVAVYVIPNGVDIPQAVRRSGDAEFAKTSGNRRTAVFLGRIYPVKGLSMLIQAWARVRPDRWRLHIIGPDEAGHRADVENAVSSAGLKDVVAFLGPLDGHAKQAALLDADLFVLPSHSESFGMAVAEALAHGVPVLTTTAVPWPMLQERGCGWRVPPTVDHIADGLRHATSLDSATLEAMGAKGRTLMAAELGWTDVARRFVSMYEALV